MAKIYRQCVQCSSDFYVNDNDQVYFAEKGLELPKRCFSCRKKNKQDRESAVSSPVSYEYEATWKDREDCVCTAKVHCPGCTSNKSSI